MIANMQYTSLKNTKYAHSYVR